MSAKRYTVHFSGRVQGVGFRYTAERKSAGFDIAGYVQNLDDGRVELVVEGEPGELDRYVQELSERMDEFIKEKTVDRSEATGDLGRPGDGIRTRR